MERGSGVTLLAYFSSCEYDFRIAELEAVADTLNIPLTLPSIPNMKDTPFIKIIVPSHEAARQLGARCVTLKGIYEVWGEGGSYEECKEDVKSFIGVEKDLYDQCVRESFKINVESYGRKLVREYQQEKRDEFIFLAFEGEVIMNNPQHIFYVFEDVGEHKPPTMPPRRVYFTREISTSGRDWILKYTLKKRIYLGTTSFDSELSLVSANHARIHPGSLVLDPFVGTGSFLVTCAHLGAMTIGGDIDIRVLRGKESGRDVRANMKQYNLESQYLGLVRFDHSHNDVFINRPLFDAIVTDPPYGVRAGAKKVGFKKGEVEIHTDNLPSGWMEHISQTVPYSVPDVLTDLYQFAARTIVLGGHLVYWLPTTNEYKDSDLPDHPCFKLLANCEQVLNTKFRRRLITLRKVEEYKPEVHGSWVAIYDYEVAHANIAAKVMNDEKRGDNRHMEKAIERQLKNGKRPQKQKILKRQEQEQKQREQNSELELKQLQKDKQ